jgi:pimeloyl-ACP methyl ester carboxylesterase
MSFLAAAARRVVDHRHRALARAFSDHVRVLAHEVHGPPFGGSKVDADAFSTIFLLHGLMGAGRNWRTFAKQLRQRLGEQHWRVCLVDLRGHGASASIGQGSGHDIVDAARDVDSLAKMVGTAPSVVVGHSLGGKVALEYSKLATTAPKQTWSLDSVPGRVEADPHGVAEVLSAIRALPRRIPSRKWLAEALPQFSTALVDWIGSNLKNVRDGGSELEFIFNLDTVTALYDSYQKTDSWHAIEDEASCIYVVKAENSSRWSPSCVERLKSSSANFQVLPNAGHWVHTDNPNGLLEILATSIPKSREL